jgi:hypothetical protein
LLTLVRSACAEALTIHPDLPLTYTDVERAIQQFGAPLRDNAQRYLKALQTVLETHSLAAIADEVQQILLDRYLVLRYFEQGEYWYDVCLPVKEHLHGRSI